MSRLIIGQIGQSNSNEAGPAGSRSVVGGLGAPYYRGTRGWWPSCVEEMAKRGHWLDVNRTAVGSTSLCDSWVGRCRAHASPTVVTRGSYVTANGGLWKSNIPTDTAAVSTVAPSGASDMTTSDGLAWVYVGPAQAGDSNGVIYTPSSPRFDPNGYTANAINTTKSRPGYDAWGIAVNIGQGDHTVSSTRLQYGTAMRIVAELVTGQGGHCFLEVTCGMSGPDAQTIAARDATMTGVIQAGRADALAALSGNPLVHAGADLRALLGVPNATSDDTALNSVNNTDYLHLTSATYDQAGKFLAAGYAAGGW